MRRPSPLCASTVLLATLASAAAAAGTDDLFVSSAQIPEVLTATRLQQTPAEVPGSVSVIDRELIRASGARSLPELLRLVPGMLVVPAGNQTTVNYHGSSVMQARRLQVLVDGRSVYRPAFAQVDWADIPLAIEDIERIEVFRGPNTVSYGANALMGVINVLTRAPRDSHGTHLKVVRGQRGIGEWYAGHGGSLANGDWRLSLSGQEDDGFDHKADGSDYRDGKRLSRLNLRQTWELDARQSLDWQLALKEGSNQIDNHYRSQLPIAPQAWEQDGDSDSRARDYAASLRWDLDLDTDHTLYVQTNLQQWERLRQWRACDVQAAFAPALRRLWALSPAYVGRFNEAVGQLLQGHPFVLPSGTAEQQALAMNVLGQLQQGYDPASGAFEHTCGLINEDSRETRFDLELQDTLSLSEHLRLVSGLSYRHDSADSPTYLNGRLSQDIGRLFGQFEWHIGAHWLLQGGAMYEYDSSAGNSLSPRIALNYLITPAHGLRAVYSSAVRSADMFEKDADWSYWVRDLRPAPAGQPAALFYMSSQGPGELEQEHIRSRELGYNGSFADNRLNLDLKLFHDEIDKLISYTPKIYDLSPDNASHLRLFGAEAELDWRIGQNDRLRLHYAHLDADASHPLDSIATPNHSGAIGWMRDWNRDWSTGVFYYGADHLNGYRFERADLRLARLARLGRSELELAWVLQQRLDDEPQGWPNNNYSARQTLWVSAEIDF